MAKYDKFIRRLEDNQCLNPLLIGKSAEIIRELQERIREYNPHDMIFENEMLPPPKIKRKETIYDTVNRFLYGATESGQFNVP